VASGHGKSGSGTAQSRWMRMTIGYFRVSQLDTLKTNECLTFSLSPSATMSEAARMQRSPVVNLGTPAIPETENRADLEPLLHDPPPPDEAADLPDKNPSEQSRAPADARGLTELPRGEALRRAIWQVSQISAHGRPPDHPDS